jgi:hypothetical protein
MTAFHQLQVVSFRWAYYAESYGWARGLKIFVLKVHAHEKFRL